MKSEENVIDANSGNPIVFRPSLYTKQMTAGQTFSMGLEFVAAGMFLEREYRKSYVSLHLLCQGMELILKSFLLNKDYDKFKKLIANNRNQHSLINLVDMVIKEYDVKELKPEAREQLSKLNSHYERQRLRYINTLSLVGYYLGLDAGLVFRKVFAAIRLAQRTIFAVSTGNKDETVSETQSFIYRR
jgi:hypothetical protein